MNLEFDQGIERIPFEFRSYCWDTAQRAQEDHWNVFKIAAMQIRFGGVSSEGEAKRLFWAEQIGHAKFFSEGQLPSEMALKLSEDIQNSFQHPSRPVTLEADPEKQTVEILNYYFPHEEALANFERALSGELDGPRVDLATSLEPAFEEPVPAKLPEENPFAGAIVAQPEPPPKPKEETNSLWNNIFAGNKKTSSLDRERPKVKLYVQARQNKQHSPLFNQLSDRIKNIIQEHYLD